MFSHSLLYPPPPAARALPSLFNGRLVLPRATAGARGPVAGFPAPGGRQVPAALPLFAPPISAGRDAGGQLSRCPVVDDHHQQARPAGDRLADIASRS